MATVSWLSGVRLTTSFYRDPGLLVKGTPLLVARKKKANSIGNPRFSSPEPQLFIEGPPTRPLIYARHSLMIHDGFVSVWLASG